MRELDGFILREESGGIALDIVMPDPLRGIFFASFYGRSKLMDKADGDPSLVWDGMSHMFNDIKLVAPRQVHGTRILDAEEGRALPLRPDGDGVFFTRDSKCFGSLRFADCAAVVLAGTCPGPWMVILHSGFMGTVKNIAASGLERVRRFFHTEDIGRAWAWIAPAICARCYCRDAAGDAGTDSGLAAFSPENRVCRGGKVFFDLKGEIAGQIAALGVRREDIFACGECTLCGSGNFYSFRGGDRDRRNFLLAGNAIS